MKTFGAFDENINYQKRVAVYGVIIDASKNQVAIVRNGTGHYFLPGGGLERDETFESCLKRETIEETGFEVKIIKYLGCAQYYFYSQNDEIHYLNEGHFYCCQFGSKVSEPIESDHILGWKNIHEALQLFVFEHHVWAVGEAIK